jgi:hypothetical protein
VDKQAEIQLDLHHLASVTYGFLCFFAWENVKLGYKEAQIVLNALPATAAEKDLRSMFPISYQVWPHDK